MDRADLVQLFRKWAAEIAEKDFSHVEESDAIADLGIDSLGMLELIGSMERELNIQIPDEKLVGIQTVRQLLELVDERLERS
jgi:acyl carrier protein